MIYQIYDLRVKKINYGWTVQKLVGSQYKNSRFFSSLAEALIYVLDYQLDRVSRHDKILLDEVKDSKNQLEKYLEEMKVIYDEIKEVFHGR